MCVAEDISASQPVTDEGVAGRLLIAVEQRTSLVQMIVAGEGRIDELNKQIGWKDEEIAHLKEIGQLKDEKIQLYQDKEKVYLEKDKTNQSLSDMKDKACIDQVKAAKPTFMQNMGKYFFRAGIGGILVLIATVL